MKEIKELTGLIVADIDIADDELRITTKCGRQFQFYHYQDCCEYVRIVDTKGDMNILKGQKLVKVSMNAYEEDPEDIEGLDIGHDESRTWTDITFATDGDTVISRWVGESNGYYSESVNFCELVNQFRKE